MVTAAALTLAMGAVRPTRATEPTAGAEASAASVSSPGKGDKSNKGREGDGASSARGRGPRPRTVFIPSQSNPLVAIRRNPSAAYNQGGLAWGTERK